MYCAPSGYWHCRDTTIADVLSFEREEPGNEDQLPDVPETVLEQSAKHCAWVALDHDNAGCYGDTVIEIELETPLSSPAMAVADYLFAVNISIAKSHKIIQLFRRLHTMSEKHIVALGTYGTHTKTRKGKRLSALKIGYTNAVAEVLLALIPTAKNISSKRDSYVYIHLPNKPKLRQNWLFVEVTAEELVTAEKITMANRYSRGIARWGDDGWVLFPCLDNPEYHAASSPYDIPKGSPHGYWSINSAGETSATGGGDDPDALIAEYSKLDPDKSAWWWIPGNDATYTHRSTLKRAGCRWRRNRRAYSYVGDQLPESLLAILDNAEECRAIMAGLSPEEAKQTIRNADSSSDTQATPIDRLIDAVLRDRIETLNTDGEFPLLTTTEDIVAGQDMMGVDDPKRVWYLAGALQAEQIQIVHTIGAEWSHTTRRWLFNNEQEIDVLDEFLSTLTDETSTDEDDHDPCTLDEAVAVVGINKVQHDEPSATYERGRMAWTTRR